jgi:small subunit ribosomal protein S10
MIGFQLIKLRLKAFESRVLDKSVKDIVSTLNRINSNFYGPIPMPRKIKKFTVNRSTNVDKKSREQFEIRSHSRVLLIESAPETVEALMKLDIAAGVDIQIKMIGGKNE